MKILFISYIDFRSAQFGASIRPQRMYKAFLDEGHEVKLLAVSQNRSEWPRRRKAVREIMKWLDANTPDLCYIESHVYPILLPCDYRLIRRLYRTGVPMGYFYRDFYWKFPDLYPRRTDFSGRLKEVWLSFLQKRTDNVLKYMDIVYFPSAESTRYFDYKDMRPLPPAGEDHLSERCPEEKTCIYVGGLDGGYGVGMLLEALEQMNAGDKTYRLILVCREKEWEAFQSPYKEAPWLEVHHTSGDGLKPLYARAAVSVIPVSPTPYTHLAVNVKLFDYLSYGLPVVVTNARAISAIVRENGIGIVVSYDAKAMAEALKSVMDCPEKRKELEEHCAKSLQNGNLWVHRVQQVTRELTERT